MFYPQLYDSPKTGRKHSDTTRHLRDFSPSRGSPNSSPKLKRSSNSSRKSNLAKQSPSKGRDIETAVKLDQMAKDLEIGHKKEDQNSGEGKDGGRESPYFALNIMKPTALSSSSSKQQKLISDVKSPMSPLTMSNNSDELPGRDTPTSEDPSVKWPWIAMGDKISLGPIPKDSENESKIVNGSESILHSSSTQKPIKAPPPKKPPRNRKTNPKSILQDCKSDCNFSSENRSTDCSSTMHSQRFRPYDKRFSDSQIETDPAPFIPNVVSHQIADLESSLEGVASHSGKNDGQSEVKGCYSNEEPPFQFKNQIGEDFTDDSIQSDEKKSECHSKELSPEIVYAHRNNVARDEPPLSPNGLLVLTGISELEYSIEPRNFSRPAVLSPSRSENISEEEEESDEDPTDRDAPLLMANGDNNGQLTPQLNRKQKPHPLCGVTTPPGSSPLITPTNSPVLKLKHETPKATPTNVLSSSTEQAEPDNGRHDLLKTGEYDTLEVKEHATCRSEFLETGVYDQLLPHSPEKILSPFVPSSTSSPHTTVEVKLRHHPKSHSPKQSSQTPTHSPSAKKKLSRRQSEDVMALVVAQERQGSSSSSRSGCSPKGNPKTRRESVGRAVGGAKSNTKESPLKIVSPSGSISGTEESINWEFVAGSKAQSVYPLDEKPKRKPTMLSFFSDKSNIFNPKKAQKIPKYLSEDTSNLNATNEQGDSPLHCYIKTDRLDKMDLILTYLVHCNCKLLDIDKKDRHGNTPLHKATELKDLWSVKILLSFGADINVSNKRQLTPLDIITEQLQHSVTEEGEQIHEILSSLHAISGGWDIKPRLLDESLNSLTNESYEIEDSVQIGTYLDDRRLAAFVFKLEELLLRQNLEFSVNSGVSLPVGQLDPKGTFFDPLISRQNQMCRINEWKSTVEFKRGAGSRMLFLDGGGIRGLVQIEILVMIEHVTGRKITELFDWIIGTSTGGILALCLVYLGMSLPELRQLYFLLREEVFVGGLLSTPRRTEALERILKEQFKEKRMADVEFPKVLISAVSTKVSPPALHFFNNCFHNKFTDELVWKVARYTSAGPTYFSECDNYVDGGVLANNPCMAAWAEINEHYEVMGLPKPKVAMAVSIGTGVYPPEQIGDSDFFGKGWLGDIRGTIKRAQQLMKLLAGALVQSESIAQTFAVTCKAIDSKFFRFSPNLPVSIRPDETDPKILLDMIIQTQSFLHQQGCKQLIDEMVRLFRHLAEVSRGLNLNK